MTVAATLWFDDACHKMADLARLAGRVPVAWFFGPDVREAWSKHLDDHKLAHEVCSLFESTPFTPVDDGRICNFAGLPAYPMICEGVALRTVAEQ